jgi:hypothetical protein
LNRPVRQNLLKCLGRGIKEITLVIILHNQLRRISSAWRTVDNEQHDAAIRRDPSAIKGGNDLLALNGWKGERQQIIVGHGGRGVLRFWPKVGFSNQILRHIDDDPGELWHALVGRPAQLFETSAAPQCAWHSLTAPGGAAPPRRQLSSRRPRGRACDRIRASRAPARARRGGPSMPKPARRRDPAKTPQSCDQSPS